MFQKLAYSMVFGEGGALGSEVVYWGHFLWILLLMFCLLFVDLGFDFICVFLLFLAPCPPKTPQLDMSCKHSEAGSVYGGLSFPDLP